LRLDGVAAVRGGRPDGFVVGEGRDFVAGSVSIVDNLPVLVSVLDDDGILLVCYWFSLRFLTFSSFSMAVVATVQHCYRVKRASTVLVTYLDVYVFVKVLFICLGDVNQLH